MLRVKSFTTIKIPESLTETFIVPTLLDFHQLHINGCKYIEIFCVYPEFLDVLVCK